MLMGGPLKLGGVRMACAHVLGLQMFHLRQDVVPVRHCEALCLDSGTNSQ
jgi:hypothetical protein